MSQPTYWNRESPSRQPPPSRPAARSQISLPFSSLAPAGLEAVISYWMLSMKGSLLFRRVRPGSSPGPGPPTIHPPVSSPVTHLLDLVGLSVCNPPARQGRPRCYAFCLNKPWTLNEPLRSLILAAWSLQHCIAWPSFRNFAASFCFLPICSIVHSSISGYLSSSSPTWLLFALNRSNNVTHDRRWYELHPVLGNKSPL